MRLSPRWPRCAEYFFAATQHDMYFVWVADKVKLRYPGLDGAGQDVSEAGRGKPQQHKHQHAKPGVQHLNNGVCSLKIEIASSIKTWKTG